MDHRKQLSYSCPILVDLYAMFSAGVLREDYQRSQISVSTGFAERKGPSFFPPTLFTFLWTL